MQTPEILKSIKKIIFVITICLLFSCTKKDEAASTNIDALKKTINIPFTPVSAIWNYKKVGNWTEIGPVDYEVKAVLTLNREDYLKLKKEFLPESSTEQSLNLNFRENWFSSSVKGALIMNDDHISIKETYNSKLFNKNPFFNGFLFFAGNNQICVYMFTN